MLRELCNQLCIRMSKYSHKGLGQVAGWLAAKAGLTAIDMTGLKLVSEDAIILPNGCRPIPKHFYDVDPAVLNQLKDGNRAILHQKMKNWQVSNEQTGKYGFMKNDQWGTLSDPKHWHKEVFQFLTLRTVKAMIADLAEASLLVIDGAWCQPLKAQFSSAEQLTLDLGKDFQQPRKVFPSSIESKSNSSKNKTRKQTPISARKDAVADFRIPESRNSADFEMHESREAGNEGRDELAEFAGLPSALVAGWTNTKDALRQLVARYGVERINATWPKAQGFKSPIAGLITLLANSPTPVPLPPSPAADDTEPDGLFEDVPGNETPAIDDEQVMSFKLPPPMTAKEEFLAQAKMRLGPAMYAKLEAEYAAAN